MNNHITWKRTLFLVLLLTISVAVFEVVFLYDFNARATDEVTEPQKVELWLFLIISLLAFIPCIALGYGRANALWGIIPPMLLNSISWYVILDNIRRQGVAEIFSKSGIMVFAIGIAVLSGFFGIIFTLLAKKVFDFFASEKTAAENKTEEAVSKDPEKSEQNSKVETKDNNSVSQSGQN